jgi:cytochrome c oxidase subunit 1
MYPEGWAKFSALLVFVGFNLTFFPQFIAGYLGQPRRYHAYAPEFQVYNVLSTAGATVLGVGYHPLHLLHVVIEVRAARRK